MMTTRLISKRTRHRTHAIVVASLVAAACARQPAPEPVPAAMPPVVTATPVTPSPTPVSPPLDRTVSPKLGSPKALTLPPVVTRTLPNGLRILVVEHHELPVADFILITATGVEADPPNRSGLATLLTSLLDEGTTSRTALQIADQEAFLGISLSTSSGWDASRISLHTPTAQLDSALALMADVTLHPSFPAPELNRLRAERLTELIQLRDRGPGVADVAYPAIIYGNEHPYGRPMLGTEASVKAITRADLERFDRTYFRPNNSTLIVVGDVTPDDIARRVDVMFGRWERAEVPKSVISAARPAGNTAVYLIDKPGAAQSSVRIGGVGVARSTKDYFGLLLANTILGGSFTSRLNQNLRETKGYTYGASSRFDMRQSAGPFTARAEIVAEKTDSALIEFIKELRAIRDTVPAAELAKAKTYLQLQMPASFETTGQIASQLVPIVLYDLPLDYYNSYAQQIDRLTQADIQRVAREYIDPSRLAIVIVGDRASIEGGVRALRLGEILVRDLSGQPIRP
jgi:predicted Zn-dependent peptidase